MLGLDLDEAPRLLASSPWNGWRRPALVRWCRRDVLADLPGDDPAAALRQRCARAGIDARGQVLLVTTLRSLGIAFNPVSFALVHDAAGALSALVAEITNTPWSERHIYVLDAAARRDGGWRFAKRFHVSPFNGMDQTYVWRLRRRGPHLRIAMDVVESGRLRFEATLCLRMAPATTRALWLEALRPPAALLTLARIYAQALRLLWLRAPFHAHPATRGETHPRPPGYAVVARPADSAGSSGETPSAVSARGAARETPVRRAQGPVAADDRRRFERAVEATP